MAQYLSPRNDYGFKTLFGKDHKKLTLNFLNAILGKKEGDKIIELRFQETEQIPELRGDRRSFLDVYCTDETGKHFIIEMQNDPQDFFFERMMYYASLIFSRQKPSPFQYDKLTPVIFIGILSKQLNNDHPDVISEHAIMNTKYNTISSRHMMYYLVELGKFDKTEDELESDTDKWLFFMKKADACKEIPNVLKNDENFVKAFYILEHMAFSETDLFNYLAAADAEGRDERIEKYAAKEAARKNAEENAKNLLRMTNLDPEMIAKTTGVSIERVHELAKMVADQNKE